jgi:DNA-binding transcriptional ArsR family regulator
LKLELPQNCVTPEDLKNMRPKDRDEAVQKMLLQILDLNTQGVTISELVDQTGISRPTMTLHMKTLVATREAYKNTRGKVSFFYKNGKVVHAKSTECRFGDRFYKFFRLENSQGNFIYIQERQVDEFRAVNVNGGIMVRDMDFIRFLTELQNFGVGVDKI